MKNSRRLLAVLAASLAPIAIGSLAAAQTKIPPAGGGYRGPGDTVPQPTPAAPQPTPHRPGDAPAQPAAPGSTPGGLAPGIPTGGGAGVPPGYDPTEPEGPQTPENRPTAANPSSWQLWWHYNRWEHLDADGLARALADTGSDGFFLGRGERPTTAPILRATNHQILDQVLPTLVEVLEQRGSTDLQIQALHACAKLRMLEGAPREQFKELCARLLRSGNQDVVEKAILALGVRGDPSFVTWLLAIVRDAPLAHQLLEGTRTSLRARAFAIHALGLIAERNEDPVLRHQVQAELSLLLFDERVEVQAAAILASGLAPLPVVGEVQGELYGPASRVEQVLQLVTFLEDEENELVARAHVPWSLARLLEGAPETLRARVAHALLVAIGPHSSEPNEVQGAAVQALGRIGTSGEEPIDEEIRKELERMAYHSSVDRLTRYLAMVALAEVSARPGAGPRPFAGIDPTRKVLVRQLVRNRGQTLCWTALALGLLEEHAAERGETAHPDGASALRQLLRKNSGAEVGGAIAIALGLMRDAEASPLLLERLAETGADQMRGYAALALGMIGAPSAVEPLRAVCDAALAQPFTLQNSAIGLTLLGDQETGTRLFELLERASDPEVQASIAAAMGWTKDPRPLSRLCERLLAAETNDTARAWTAVAIGRICDPDDVPWVGRLSIDVQYDVDLPTLIEPRFLTGVLDMP